MSGSSRSMAKAFFSGLRVGLTELTPAYSVVGANGQAANVSARLKINAYANIPGKANNGQGRKDIYTFTVWGKMATIGAWLFAPGKEFCVFAEPHVYDKRIFFPSPKGSNQPGTPVINPATGQQLTIRVNGFTIRDFTLGEDSNRTINDEIRANIRPADWRTDGSPGQQAWKAMLKARLAMPVDVSKPYYGYARLQVKRGQGIGAYNPALDTRADNQVDTHAMNDALAAMGGMAGVPFMAPTAPPAAGVYPVPVGMPAAPMIPAVPPMPMAAPTGAVPPFNTPAPRGF